MTIIGFHLYNSTFSSQLLLEASPGALTPGNFPITGSASEISQQEQMRLRAKTQGLYMWGSNR